MSKRQFKSQASSGRAGGTFGGFGSSTFGTGNSSILSYIQEPPDYSSIGDPNVTVAFKNLSKKDATTKFKALEDLQAYVDPADAEITDAFLEAWAKIFPRLSIDSARRVRQLSHTLNGQICAKCGKRTVKHMPRIAGPWLAGTFDNDRAAAKAAADALNLVFSSPEKIYGVRRTFQRSIIEFCQGAALHETVNTLSDERTINSDEAIATYARVVSTSLSVMTSLVSELQLEDRKEEQQLYDETFQDPKLWELVCTADPGVRRSIHRLVRTALDKQPELLQDHLKIVSSAYVYKGLHADQTGSALDFIQTLGALTWALPIIWTDAYSGKRSATSRLRHLLKQGSQSASAEYWQALKDLFKQLPRPILTVTSEEAAQLLSSARTGVSRKEERFNASSAWPAYFTLVDIVLSSPSDLDQQAVLDKHVMPAVRQYLQPAPETAEWSITGAKAALVVSTVSIVKGLAPLLEKEWPDLANNVIEVAKLSHPEQSKDFEKSQKHVASTGERWADLQKELWNTDNDFLGSVEKTFVATNTKILEECIALVVARNGKPYGAAAVIEQLLRQCSGRLLSDEVFRTDYTAFVEKDVPALIFSSSQRQLIYGLYAANTDPMFHAAFETLLRGVVDADESADSRLTALRQLFPQSAPAEAVQIAKGMPELQEFFVRTMPSTSAGTSTTFFADLVKLDVLAPETTDAILTNLTTSLAVHDESESSLEALEMVSKADVNTVKEFMSKQGEAGEHLLPNLLRLEQSSNDTVAERATALTSRLSSAIGESKSSAKYNVVLQNLESVSAESLPMDAVHDLTNRLVGSERTLESPLDILPDLALWQRSLCATLMPLRQSLAILSPLGGATHFVRPDNASKQELVRYDGEGLSQALRMAMYAGKLLIERDILPQLGAVQDSVLALLYISVLAAEDNISILGVNGLWKAETPEDTEAQVLEFITEAHRLLSGHWKGLLPRAGLGTAEDQLPMISALERVQEGHGALSVVAYYVELGKARVRENQIEHHGFSTKHVESLEAAVKHHRAAKELLPLVSILVGLQQPLSGTPTLNRFCNELVADLTDLNIEEQEQTGLQNLVILSTIVRTQEDIITGIAKQRLIFLVKRLLAWLESDISLPTRSEVCKLLAHLFPGMADMYGEHWEQALQFITSYWTSFAGDGARDVIEEGHVLLQHASLRLLATLKKLAKSGEPNDDLVDALKDKEESIRVGLVNLLTSANGVSDETHQPLMITHELLARQIGLLPFKPAEDLGDLYPLMYTPSRPVQEAAFELLHKQVPAAQEQISLEAALDNKTAQLPDELLSLILEAPTLDSLANAPFERSMPLSLRGYLFSWRLLFDHFNGSSFRVKGDYIEQLKDGTYLSDLLSLTFDFLGHTRGRPVDVSKLDVQVYIPDTEPSPEKDLQWLLTHLYFQALTYLPSLVKSYYLDIRSRQTSQAVENWTAKYISPPAINASLQAVAEWSEKSVKEDPEYEKMNVKVGMRSKEISVGYIVDEQTMAMKVVLPDAYPLVSAQVQGVSRVAVKEEKWQSWLRNCQGVITFSNGSITDGLSAWRKNVTGALKGQSECAICYSIISADKQLPTKRCPTCKNLFHSSCLFKWFKTSNASTCPLCRNPFNFN
ncbi:hypothetical protein LTR37_012881 [Vermiconidia calcicola]|uniref:Uncharacterized protein n=1 Tax=Vermiconidia calcicola TaxID=1690605 RepID=A0ACC3MZ71_9PEZI|nr:hypothetical protein LTR37_012881 [Vermiconidia calcicola]